MGTDGVGRLTINDRPRDRRAVLEEVEEAPVGGPSRQSCSG